MGILIDRLILEVEKKLPQITAIFPSLDGIRIEARLMQRPAKEKPGHSPTPNNINK